jgi:hypothetical protein
MIISSIYAQKLNISGFSVGGMGGSYSNLAALDSGRYVFAWQSRGAVNLTPDSWMGDGFTQASPRWLNHNVAIATMDSKNKLAGSQAISTVGAASGDDQVSWITKDSGVDHQNVRVAAAGSGQLAVVTWEQITSPNCKPVPLSCSGTFAGTYAQLIDATGTGSTVGDAINLGTGVTVSGDIATIGTSICWPFVKQTWDLSKPKSTGTPVTKMSFACLSTDGTSAKTNTTSAGVLIAAVNSTSATTPISGASLAPAASSTSVTPTDAETSTSVAETAVPTSQVTEPITTAVQQSTSDAPEPTSSAPEPSSTTIADTSVQPTASTATSRTFNPAKHWGRPYGLRSRTYSRSAAAQTPSCN